MNGLKTTFLTLSLTAFGVAHAGVSSSGGAGVVVCGSDVRLLDTFEARNRGLELERDLGSIKINYRAFTAKILAVVESSRAEDEAYIDAYTDQVLDSLYRDNFKFLPPGSDLEPTNDYGETPELPGGCSLKQLAVYDDSNQAIKIDSDYWEALSSQDRAAMIAHELLYREYRSEGAISSENIRRLVGDYFSINTLPSLFQGAPDSAAKCTAIDFRTNKGGISGRLFPSQNGTRMLFGKLNNYNLYQQQGVNFGVFIEKQFLQTKLDRDGKVRVYVNDPAANFEQVVEISDGMFAGYSLALVYRFNQPMLFKLFAPNGSLYSTSTVISCN